MSTINHFCEHVVALYNRILHTLLSYLDRIHLRNGLWIHLCDRRIPQNEKLLFVSRLYDIYEEAEGA